MAPRSQGWSQPVPGDAEVQHPHVFPLLGTGVVEKENLHVKVPTASGNTLFLYPRSWQKGLSSAAGFGVCLHSNNSCIRYTFNINAAGAQDSNAYFQWNIILGLEMEGWMVSKLRAG